VPIFSFMLSALAAVVLYAGVEQFYIAVRKRGSPLHLTFSLISLAILGSIIANLIIVNSDSAGDIIEATRLRVICVSLGGAVIPWFASYYTGFRPRAFMITLSAVTLIFMIARALDPFLLAYNVILDPGTITLPWNEQISVFNARANQWMYVYYIIGFTLLGFLYVSALYLFRRGSRGRAAALAVSVTLLLATQMNDMLVIIQGLHWMLLGDFGWLAMVVLLEFSLTEDIIRAGDIKISLIESEQTLRLSEEKYRLLAENVTDVIWTMDLDTNVTFVSPSTEKLHGWSIEEWKKMRPDQYLPPESLVKTMDTIRKELELAARDDYDRKRVVTYEVEQNRKNGAMVWTEVSAKFIWNDSGKPAGIIGVTRDISERKKAEAAMIQHNKVLTMINRLGIELASLPSGQDIYSFLARELKDISGAAAVIVSEYDQKQKHLIVKHFELDKSLTSEIETAQLLDSYLTVIPVSDDSYARMISEKVAYRKTLNELTFGAVPEEISAYIIQTFSLNRYIGIAYIYEGTLYGTSVLAIKEGLPDPQEELLRSFASLAAVSLRRNRAEEKLIKSLEEKNVLIKEVHHRVKNNLQVIISLLNLQAARITDPGAQSLQNESIARLHSMALIHESIYRSENFVDIDMGPYVKELVSLLLATYSIDESAIRVAISVRDVSLNVDRAIPCALLLNELVTNVLKHGIKKDSGPGQLDLSFARSGDAYCLVVKDRGPCMDAEAFYSETQKTLGIQLIKALVRQLGGTVELTIDDGCSFAIKFPVAG
jgi:PAS domain S-box-containing protein